MQLIYRLTADLVVTAHFGFFLFVVVGLFAIVVGSVLHKSWARNRKFRFLHLSAIVIVAFEAILGISCPLTSWEQRLRTLAGDATYTGSFVGNWINALLFVDLAPWMVNLAHCLFALVVVLVFFLAPPHPRQSA